MERNGNDSARGRMDSSMRVLALQKKTLGTPRENLDRVRQMLKDAVPSAMPLRFSRITLLPTPIYFLCFSLSITLMSYSQV